MICSRRYGAYQPPGKDSSGGRKKVSGTGYLPLLQEHAYKAGQLNLEIVAVDSTLIDSNHHANHGTHEHENGL